MTSAPASPSLAEALALYQDGRFADVARVCRQALSVEPGSGDALHLLGLALMQQHGSMADVRFLDRAVAAMPDPSQVQGNLLLILRGLSAWPEIFLRGTRWLARHDTTELRRAAIEAALRMGEYGSASRHLLHLVNADPRPDDLVDLGICLARLDDPSRARGAFRTALVIQPTHVPAMEGLSSDGMTSTATWLRRRTSFAPTETSLCDLGHVEFHLGRKPAARAAYRRSLAVDPSQGRAWGGLAAALDDVIGRIDSAAALRSLLLSPADMEMLHIASDVLRRRDQLRQSLLPAKRMIALSPGDIRGHRAMALSRSDLAEYDRSIRSSHRLLAISPLSPEMRANHGMLLKTAERLPESLPYLRQAIALAPDFGLAHYSLSMGLLALGDFDRGWPGHEWRFRPPSPVKRRSLGKPLWSGGLLPGKKLLVVGEQGVGDEIYLSTMLADLKHRGIDFIFECDHRLCRIFERSYPDFTVVPRTSPPHPSLLGNDIAAEVSLFTIARWLRATLTSFKRPIAHFIPDPERVTHCRRRLDDLGSGPKIGIAWRSIRRDAVGRWFHTELEHWRPILETKSVQFVNLQYGDCSKEIDTVSRETGCRVHRLEEIDLFNDLDGVLALGASLDLVISTGTTAYLPAGVAGTPTWLLTPWYDFPLHGTDYMPWIPHARVFRRRPGETWARPIQEIADALAPIARTWPAHRRDLIRHGFE